MNTIGYIGISVGFVLLAVLVLGKTLWRAHHAWRAVLVAGVLWFGVALYYATLSFTGWPSPQNIPEGSRVVSIRIEEPNIKHGTKGGIYLWLDVSEGNREAAIYEILAGQGFSYYSDVEPRAYKIPYSKSTHKKIISAMKQRKRGYQLFVKGKKKGKGKKRSGKKNKSVIEFKIINPVELLKK